MTASPPRLRLLMTSPVYAPCVGGGERLLQMVAEGLAGRGHHVTVVTLDAATHRDMGRPSGAGLAARDTLNGVHLVRVPPGGGRVAALIRWVQKRRGGWRSTRMVLGEAADWLLRVPGPLGMLPTLLTHPADLIVSANWGFVTTEMADWAARRRGVPVVALPLFHIARPWSQQPRFPPLLQRTSAVVALTRSEAEFAKVRGARRVEVIGCAVDPKRLGSPPSRDLRAALGLSGQRVVGFVGRQDFLKGVPTLIEAMRLIWNHEPDVALLLAGPAAHRDEATRFALAGLRPEERSRVRLRDDFPDHEAADIFDACDVIALPSVEEAFGLVYLEAWMRRRPVVGARVPSTVDVIAHGVDGLIVEPMDPSALARALGDLLRSPGMRTAMGDEGHRKVAARFTLDRIVDQWEALLRDVAARGAAC